jgi:hypothetical protein
MAPIAPLELLALQHQHSSFLMTATIRVDLLHEPCRSTNAGKVRLTAVSLTRYVKTGCRAAPIAGNIMCLLFFFLGLITVLGLANRNANLRPWTTPMCDSISKKQTQEIKAALPWKNRISSEHLSLNEFLLHSFNSQAKQLFIYCNKFMKTNTAKIPFVGAQAVTRDLWLE